MSTIELIAGISAVMQVGVACYALWLNTHFGANRAGWALFGAFALMALLYVTRARETDHVYSTTGVDPELVYLFISILLLVGMSHVHQVFHERRVAEKELLKAQELLEERVQARTSELAKVNQSLLQEVTRRQELEKEFLHAQRMEALGQLAVGVAHDFNNILTVISGYTQLLIAKEPSDTENAEYLQQVSTAAERASNLTRQLLTFTRKQVMQAKPLDLPDAINDMTKLLRRIIGEDITLLMCTAGRLPLIMADPDMMGQILLNLAVNARDAMPEGGQLVVATEAVEINQEQLSRHPEGRAGQFICLTVQDSGCGMSPDVLARVFEPFFTTKAVGKGTGLGLATVYGIVKHHEGWIEVASKPGRGTAFHIFLPQTSELPNSSQTIVTTSQKALHGSETILVVEDEPEVRNLARVVLERYGYRVLEARSGVVALAVWEENQPQIALVFTDMVMPDGLTGRDLAAELQRRQPDLKVIYTSGYSPGLASEDLKIMEGVNFMHKPYHPQKLAQAVRNCLDGQLNP